MTSRCEYVAEGYLPVYVDTTHHVDIVISEFKLDVHVQILNPNVPLPCSSSVVYDT